MKQTLARDPRRGRATAAGRGPSRPPTTRSWPARSAAPRRSRHGLTPVINATGVVLHTGLGRAPLPEAAARAAGAGRPLVLGPRGRPRDRRPRAPHRARGDAAHGAHRRRGRAGREQLRRGAPARASPRSRSARRSSSSRGELIEIGGEFRIPDILAASRREARRGRHHEPHADRRLSRRRLRAHRRHPARSIRRNYRVVGFTAAAPAEGPGGARATSAGSRSSTTSARALLANGARDAAGRADGDRRARRGRATSSRSRGDKLLGGPQAGIVVGRADLIEKLRRNPIARAVRVDKMQVAALEARAGAARDGHGPGRRSPCADAAGARRAGPRRAQRARASRSTATSRARTCTGASPSWAAAPPRRPLPSWGVRVAVADPTAFAARLRDRAARRSSAAWSPTTCSSTCGRSPPTTIPHLARAILYALEGDELDRGLTRGRGEPAASSPRPVTSTTASRR